VRRIRSSSSVVLLLTARYSCDMATIKMTRQWDRWAGTIPDLERATRLAAEVLNPRTGEPRCHIEIALPGRVIEADTPDALVSEIDTRDLSLIRNIRIQIGSRRSPRASIHIERQSPAVTVEVVGEDRTRVEGLASQLAELFTKGRQRPGPNALVGIGLAVAAALVFVGVWIVNTLGLQDDPGVVERRVTPVGFLMLLLTALGTFAVFLVGNWLFPGLELLEVGSNTRARRFRLAIVALLGGILSSLAATVVYELIR
jgi:hypothetical protein